MMSDGGDRISSVGACSGVGEEEREVVMGVRSETQPGCPL
jgi:hypothetical protein